MKKLFVAEIFKLKIVSEYKFLIISCFFSAIVSVLLIKFLGIYINDVPLELIERIRFNNMYNFGFIQVKNISELDSMTALFVVSSAFKNYFPTINVAIYVSIFIRNEFSNGGIRNFIIKGFERRDVLISKFVVISCGITVALIVYYLGYTLASTLMFTTEGLFDYSIMKTMTFLLLQILLHISFASICFMSSVCIRKSHLITFFNASMVVGVTMFLNNLLVITNGKYNFFRYWVLDYVANLSPIGGVEYRQLFFAGVFTLFGSFLITKRYFEKIQFE